MTQGAVVSVHIGDRAAGPMRAVRSVEAVVGRGLEGDRYFRKAGTWSSYPDPAGKQVTLIDEAVVAELLAQGLASSASATRRNLITAAVQLGDLAGRSFRVGGAILFGVRKAEPCRHLESLSGPGLQAALRGRGGLRADVVAGGRIAVGDPVLLLGEDVCGRRVRLHIRPGKR